MNDIFIAFVMKRWRVIACDNLVASFDTEEEAKAAAARIQDDPEPLRAYLGLNRAA